MCNISIVIGFLLLFGVRFQLHLLEKGFSKNPKTGMNLSLQIRSSISNTY